MSNNNMDVIKKQFLDKNRMIGYIGSALLIIGSFLPFYGAFGFSIKYVDMDPIVLILGVAAAVLLYLDKRMLSVIPGAGALLLVLYAMGKTAKSSSLLGYQIGSFQLGAYILVIAAALVVFNALKKAK